MAAHFGLWSPDKVNLYERQGQFEDKMGKVSSHFGAGPGPGRCPKPVKFEANLGREYIQDLGSRASMQQI